MQSVFLMAAAMSLYFSSRWLKQQLPHARIVGEIALEGVDFNQRHPTMQMCRNIMWLGRWAVVNIAANVEVVVFLLKLADQHIASILRHIRMVVVDVCDFFNVFRPQRILVLAFFVFPVCIDEQHAFPLTGLVFVDDQHAGRDSGAIKETGWQSDDRFQHTVLDEPLAALPSPRRLGTKRRVA